MEFNLKNLILIIMVVTFTPVFVQAKESNVRNISNTNTQIKTEGDFCSRIETLRSKYTSEITKVQEKSLKGDSDREDKLVKKESDLDDKLALSRLEIDSKRTDNWNKILGKAKNSRERAAVDLYKFTISKAVEERRDSIDRAIKAYHEGLLLTNDAHTKSIDEAVLIFKSDVDKVFSRSKADCGNKTPSNSVKDNFNKSMNDARMTLEATRKNAEMTGELASLKKTLDNALKLAEATFKRTTEKARATLLSIFK